ncbi:MAG: hypothetical protein ACLS6R_03560, partial [Eggerthella lenta]
LQAHGLAARGFGLGLAARGFGLGSRAANQGSRLAGRALADLGLRALPERGGGYPSKCSAATSS